MAKRIPLGISSLAVLGPKYYTLKEWAPDSLVKPESKVHQGLLPLDEKTVLAIMRMFPTFYKVEVIDRHGDLRTIGATTDAPDREKQGYGLFIGSPEELAKKVVEAFNEKYIINSDFNNVWEAYTKYDGHYLFFRAERKEQSEDTPERKRFLAKKHQKDFERDVADYYITTRWQGD